MSADYCFRHADADAICLMLSSFFLVIFIFIVISSLLITTLLITIDIIDDCYRLLVISVYRHDHFIDYFFITISWH